MTVDKFNSIKEQIQEAKKKADMAEGAMEKIKEQWKKDLSINSIEEAEKKLDEIKIEIEKDKSKLNKMYSNLEEMHEWEDE